MTRRHPDPVDGRTEFEYGKDGPRAVLVGVDNSESSLNALAYAVGAARRGGCRLVVLWVRSLPAPAIAMAGLSAQIVSDQDEIESSLRAVLRGAEDLLPAGVDIKVTIGDPARELQRIAREMRADQIVVGASRTRRHKVFGGIGQRLLRACDAPVTVVP